MEFESILRTRFFYNEKEIAEITTYIDNVFDKVVKDNNFGIFFNKNNRVEDIFNLIYDKFLMEITPTIDDITIVKHKIGEYGSCSECEEWNDKAIKFGTLTDDSFIDVLKDYIKEKITKTIK